MPPRLANHSGNTLNASYTIGPSGDRCVKTPFPFRMRSAAFFSGFRRAMRALPGKQTDRIMKVS